MGKFIAAVVLVGLVIGFFNGSFGDDETSGSDEPAQTVEKDVGDEWSATYMCKGFVEDKLKSPSTADFSDEKVTGRHPVFTVKGSGSV